MAVSSPRMRIPRPADQTIHRSSSRSFHASLSSSKSWHTVPAQPPTAHPDTAIPLPEQLRSIMRLLTHSVVVCTSTQDTTPRAMTMSSFTSLTLSPTPLITFNVATPSRTLGAIASSGKFNIHVLAGDPDGAAVASHFTRGNVGGHVLDGLEDVVCDAEGVLRGKGVLLALRCRVLGDAPEGGLVKVRDHVIVVGEVVEMVPVSKAEEFGLVYADRKYRQVGRVLSIDGE
ncbi:Fc.00g075560.m01.CDS01 [Cosmosporella sp. VM-42]